MKKHVLAVEETCCVMFSLLSRRTLRSRITSDGGIPHCGSRLGFFVVLSSTLLRRPNQMCSGFVAFSFSRMDAHQDWMEWTHAAIFILVFSRFLQPSFMSTDLGVISI